MLTLCGAIATALTGIMFFTRNSLLGFPAGSGSSILDKLQALEPAK